MIALSGASLAIMRSKIGEATNLMKPMLRRPPAAALVRAIGRLPPSASATTTPRPSHIIVSAMLAEASATAPILRLVMSSPRRMSASTGRAETAITRPNAIGKFSSEALAPRATGRYWKTKYPATAARPQPNSMPLKPIETTVLPDLRISSLSASVPAMKPNRQTAMVATDAMPAARLTMVSP